MRRQREVRVGERRQDVVDAREEHDVRIEIEDGPARRLLEQAFQRERLDRGRELDDAVRKRPRPPVGNAEVGDLEDRVERLAGEIEPLRPLVGERDVDDRFRMVLPERAAQDPHLRQVIDRGAGEDVQGVRHRRAMPSPSRARRARRVTPIIVASAAARVDRRAEPPQVVLAEALARRAEVEGDDRQPQQHHLLDHVGERLRADRRKEDHVDAGASRSDATSSSRR